MAEYDFFISYRWNMYSNEAQEMAKVARSRGYSVWIDRENPPLATTDQVLAEHLRGAIASCSYIIFFETTAQVVAQVNGPSIREYCWQERELDYAEARQLAVLYHGHRPPLIGFGINRNLCPYDGLSDAFGQVEKAMADPTLFISQRSPCGGGGPTASLAQMQHSASGDA